MPTTHTATVNLPRLQLLHSILNFRSINLRQLIVDEAFAGFSRKQSPLLFPRLITALYLQKGVMEDGTDFYIRGRQGIKPMQIPSLMGFDEDATAKSPSGGALTIAAARLIELMALTEQTQEQMQDMQEKMISLFHYLRERDEAIQSYFLELLPDERAPQEQATPQPLPAKKNVASTSTVTPKIRPPDPGEHADPAIPHAHASASTPKPSVKNTTATRRTLTRKDKGKAPAKPTPRTPAPEATVELDSDDVNNEDMPDVPQPPASVFDTFAPHRRFKRKANRNINIADLAAKEDAASDAEEDNGSNTTWEETPMTSQPQSKALYKRVASKPTPK
ncbi:hypothetical protein V6N11_035290 [Hibiscus sabdariffa]|uniref:Uncharacterized protein n=1 Tax=Hibiscus sabdariffa TaxID=183260 RepID=A0ABR2R0C3_9ROSI